MGTPPSTNTISRFSEDERQEIASEYQNGDGVHVIGKKHKASDNTIRYLLKVMNVTMRKLGDSRANDITGQRFERLVAIKLTGQILTGQGRQWEFMCDCGETTYSTVHSVRSGNKNSCGCYNKDRIKETQRLDHTNQRVGSLTGLHFSHNRIKKNGNNGNAYWEWQCDCGGKVVASGAGVTGRFIRNGDVSCNQCAGIKRGLRSSIDLTGKRFGLLTGVKQLTTNVSPAFALWQWRCDCGKLIEMLAPSVKKNENANCGCKKTSTANDGTGKRFGLLTAIKSLGKKPGESTYTWLFQCDCGKICESRLRDAVSGRTQSCGCGKGGYDNINNWIAGEFRNAEDKAFFYVFPLAHFPGYSKPGIAEDLSVRRKGSRGQYGKVHDFIELPRLDAWLLEQAVLRETRLSASCPTRLEESKWEGFTEVRALESNVLFDLAISLQLLLQELGREEFAIRYLVTSPKQQKELIKRVNYQG